MFKQLTNLFKDELVKVKTVKRTAETRGRKSLSKKQKVLNLLSKGENVAWKTIQSKFDLESPRAMIDTLRAEGYMIFGNRVGGKKYYRMGTPTRAIIAAGIQALYGTKFKYNNHKVSVKKSDLILGITTSVSGSPILTLYSITFGSAPTFIKPMNKNP